MDALSDGPARSYKSYLEDSEGEGGDNAVRGGVEAVRRMKWKSPRKRKPLTAGAYD